MKNPTLATLASHAARPFRRALSRLAAVGAAAALASAPANAQTEQVIRVRTGDDQLRRALVVLPPQTDGLPLPVVLAFHGGGGNAESFRDITGLDDAGARFNFIAVFADAGDGDWGDWRTSTGLPDVDLAYVRLVLLALRDIAHVDVRRVYATGLSNGGSFSQVIAAELDGRLAAVGPVANNLSEAFVDNATPRVPTPLIQIVGTDDPVNPFEGGPAAVPGDEPLIGSDATMAYWAEVNGNAAPTPIPLPNGAQDGTFARRDVFAGGRAPLQRIVVTGGGHTWPGGEQYLPVNVIGRTSRDFNANDELWAFFQNLTAPCAAADYDLDTLPGTIFDLFDFLEDLDAGLDFNADGSPADIFDLFDFLEGLDRLCT